VLFQQVERAVWVPGEGVQIARLPSERKASAELGLKRRAQLGRHRLGTRLVSKSSLRVWPRQREQLTELEQTGELSGPSAPSRVISLAHV